MAVTALIRQVGDADLSLTLDVPRIVIGRSKGSDIQLPDPSVSPRHASIRLQGGRNLVMDEGSTNGVLVVTPGERASAAVRLPPLTPRVLADGDFIRIGRIWLEVSFRVGVPSTSADVKRVAHAVLRHALQEDGERCFAHLELAGAAVLELQDEAQEHVLGRAKDCALVINDALASRRHAALVCEGRHWVVRDLGSKRGTTLAGDTVTRAGNRLRDGAQLTIGSSVFVFRDPLENALTQMRAAEDVKLSAAALPATPPGMVVSHVVDAPAEGGGLDGGGDLDEIESIDGLHDIDHVDEDDPAGFSALDRLVEEPRGAGFAAVDAFLVLVALIVLGVSMLGLAYVLG